jgi:HSP20 family protein
LFDLTPFRSPRNEITGMFDEMERNLKLGHFSTDIVDKGDRYILKAELPGFEKEDINIEVENNRLTISAQHDMQKEDSHEDYIRRERRTGSFMRNFDVSHINTEEIHAEYKNGILLVELIKKDQNSTRGRRIDIH